MPIDRRILDELALVAVHSPDDLDREAAFAELREHVRRDAAGVADLLATMARAGEDTSWYEAVVVALRDENPDRFRALLDLVAAGLDELWAAIADSYDDDAQLVEIVDHLGLPTVSRAWHESSRSDPGAWWPIDLSMRIESWATEQRHREFLLQLINDADDQTIWHAAAGPLEDFISDDEDRLQWIETHARRDAKFRKAVSGVWVSSESAATAQRIAAIVGEPDRG